MGSASQQLSQLAGGGSLSSYMTYLLLCDAMFWVLATWFCICVFLKHICFLFHIRVFASLLSGFLVPFLCLKGLAYTKLFAKLSCCRTLCPFP
jgi:hypothetical protein